MKKIILMGLSLAFIFNQLVMAEDFCCQITALNYSTNKKGWVKQSEISDSSKSAAKTKCEKFFKDNQEKYKNMKQRNNKQVYSNIELLFKSEKCPQVGQV